MIKIKDDVLETIFEKAKNIKPKYNLTAEQMDELNEILNENLD